LGGGFFAASLVGPPEVIDRLSRYLQPSGLDDSEGLRPLAVNTTTGADPWAAPAVAPPTNQVASVAAMMPSGSWPVDAPTPNVAPASPWGTASSASTEPAALAAPSLDAAAPSQDWLTSENLAAPALHPAETPVAGQALTPVPRGGVAAAAQTSAPASAFAAPAFAASAQPQDEPSLPASDGWPELRAPAPPMSQQASQPNFDSSSPQEVTVAKPAVETSPYEARPRFDAASTGFDSDRNPLRYDASAGQSFDPIERQPAATGETFVQHIVTDGDTLPSIAQRYLGDAARAQELFELNRDRLQHPDVLPIGMVLKAPKSRPAAQPAAPTISATGVGYPHLERPGDFSTVSASEAYLPPVATAQRRPLTAIGSTADRPLTDEQRLGPIDAVYQQEFAWDANGW
jgi:nucleoid-associated protein YgaU